MEEIIVSDQTRYVVAYLIHDAAANMEAQISDYDPARLQEAENSGLVILAEYSDGMREIVKAKDVREPEPKMNGITLVQPAYVDDRMLAVVDVLDAVAELLAYPEPRPEPAAIESVDDDLESNGPDSIASSEFTAALERLKVMVNGNDA